MPSKDRQKRERRSKKYEKERNAEQQSQENSLHSDHTESPSSQTNNHANDSAMQSPSPNMQRPLAQDTPYTGMTGLALGTPRRPRILSDSSTAPPPKRRPRIDEGNSSSPSQSMSENSDQSVCSTGSRRGRPKKRPPGPGRGHTSSSSSPVISEESDQTGCNMRNRGGRPRKQRGGPGRGHRTPSLVNTSSISNAINANTNVTPSLDSLNQTVTPNFHTMNTLNFPLGNPLLPIAPRVGADVLYASQSELEQLWTNPRELLEDQILYSYLRYLASIVHDTRIVVVDPAYTNLDMHGDQIGVIDPLFNCYNYSDDFDIILLPVYFTGHYGLVIYDRQHEDCVYVDPMPPSPFDGYTDRLYDPQYPRFDPRRIELIKKVVSQLTPGLNEQDFFVEILSPMNYTRQTDDVNCGFFVALYSEACVFSQSLLFGSLDIAVERKRILWHLAQLMFSNDVPHVPRQAQPFIRPAPIDPSVGSFPATPIRQPRQSTPIPRTRRISLTPRAGTPLRRSPRIASRDQSRGSSVGSDRSVSPAPQQGNPITQRCYLRHRGYYCADVRARHIPDYYDSGNLGDKKCDYCNAKLFNSEAVIKNGRVSSSCCQHGTVSLPAISDPPDLLRELSTSNSAEAKEFRSKQNAYNSLLAFASVTMGHRESSVGGDVCFLLNGEFVRQISSIYPGTHQPSFTQLFILDPTQALEHRRQNTRYSGDRVNANTLRRLDELLREHHPLAQQLMNFHEQYLRKLQEEGPDAVQNFRLTLLEARLTPADVRDPNLHPRQTNLPDENTLFSVWTESEYPPAHRGIWITTADGTLQEIRPWHPMTDSLCYPLLLPNGDDGFHINLTVARPQRAIHARHNADSALDDEASEHDSLLDSEVSEDDDDLDARDISGCSEGTSYADEGPGRENRKMSLRTYVRYRMAIRGDQCYHHIWSAGGGLTQKLILDYSARIDANVATWLRRPELDLRASLPEHVLNFLARMGNLASTDQLGRVVLFRKTQPGSTAFFRDQYWDSTTIMSRVKQPGRACFFLTFTCNPQWREIKENLLRADQKTVDRFDILSRVYEDKLRHLHYLLDKKHILGKILGYGESREFQKRAGGPHLHRVYQTNILSIVENIDNLIWAHIPEEPPNDDVSDWAYFLRRVRVLVGKHQMHDCGEHCRNARGRCSKGFPKPYSNSTVLFTDKPALYRRPSPFEGGQELILGRGSVRRKYDNSHVVAYNPFILCLFETHHNLEFAYGHSTNLKYALKYPFKGPSFSYIRSNVDGTTDVDEPAYFAKMLYRSPVEGYSRILSYKYAFLSHFVKELPVHLPGKQMVYFRPGQAQQVGQQIIAGQLPETELTAYWKQWEQDPELRDVLYEQLPEKYTFVRGTKTWRKLAFSANQRRVENRKPRFGRMKSISPRDPERYALYLLMKHFSGNPKHLLTVNINDQDTECTSFGEAARMRGLIQDSNVWIRTLEEGSHTLMPREMRQLLANILCFGNTEGCVIDGALLWNRFLHFMYEPRRINSDAERTRRIDRALTILERLLVAQGYTCADFGLPIPTVSIISDPNAAVNNFFFPGHLNDDDEVETIDRCQFDNARLNDEQYGFFDIIRNVMQTGGHRRLYFLSGDAGTGKTYLLNYILYRLRGLGAKVIPTASTGIASTRFYAGGMTVHSAFRIGIDIQPGRPPSIPMDNYFGRRIIEADVIIIDEISMLHKDVLEIVDLTCRQLVPNLKDIPFAGKIVITSGDWKQSLPIVEEEYGEEAQIAACFQSSPLYPLFEKIKLMQNMRVNPQEREFLEFLRKVGTGETGDYVAIPQHMLVDTLEEAIAHTFDQGFIGPSNLLLKRLMLAPTNLWVDHCNNIIVRTFTGQFLDYFSEDLAINENPLAANAADYDVSQLNQLMPTNFPPHHLRLTEGLKVVLLRNLNTRAGLCNGTTMIVTKLTRDLIFAEALTGGASRSGVEHGLPRCYFTYRTKRLDKVSFGRFQFPVKIAYSMTVTKAQGQTCEKVGIDFTHEPFAHGQLYTSYGRAESWNDIKVYAPNKQTNDEGEVLVRNVVAKNLRLD